MSRIDVTKEGSKYKVMINFCQRGIALSTPQLANQEAQRIHDKECPQSDLNLINEA